MTTLDYKDTLALPQTDFPMRAGLAQKEPEILAFWQEIDLYKTLMDTTSGLPTFNLHWGPPYANGNLHVGHCIGLVLKDAVCRSKRLAGYHVPLVPGWDCHGLPIEWKVEEGYREKGQDKDAVDVLEFRNQCRQFASHWIGVHTEIMQRVGMVANFADPYRTMDNASEAAIAEEIHKFLHSGALVRGVKPVMWSVVEKTALAEAEVEYKEHTSKTIYVGFPVVSSPIPEAEGAEIVIWTTTPWTIPANRALAMGADIEYGVYKVEATEDESLIPVGKVIMLAAELAETFQRHTKITQWSCLKTVKGAALAGLKARHPLKSADAYYSFDVPLLTGDFVTTEAGTGFVHIAPSHGEDDFRLGQANGVPTPDMVDDAGRYETSVGLFAGMEVYTQAGKEGPANNAVIEALKAQGHLYGEARLRHQYPHSWRSKAPLIFRTTPQWFISMEVNGLRDKALKAISDTKWIPESGENRIRAMVETRPDWCISRQRAWGVPLSFYVNKVTKEPLRDPAVSQRIIAAYQARGCDAWYDTADEVFLGSDYNPADYDRVNDIVDVWFESGATHAFVCEAREDLTWPADMYLEGSDQHRGWFQSSLLESCGTRERAPFKEVLTTGFVLDGKGYKMSKSLGNVITAEDAFEKYGADIIRLWVLSANYFNDLRVSPEILKTQQDMYRRVRNTLRFLLGNLDGFSDSERVPLDDTSTLEPLEVWMLARLEEVSRQVKAGYEAYDFNRVTTLLHDFCNLDLSAFYFDIRKDRLYCDAPQSMQRRQSRTVLAEIFSCLTAWLAPILAYTAEEAWLARPEGLGQDQDMKSVHMRQYPQLPEAWANPQVLQDWARFRELRRVITGALEVARNNKVIGSSLAAHPQIFVESEADAKLLAHGDLMDLVITSQITVTKGALPEAAFTLPEVGGVGVLVETAMGDKCERCWKILPEVSTHNGVCSRCAEVVKAQMEAAA